MRISSNKCTLIHYITYIALTYYLWYCFYFDCGMIKENGAVFVLIIAPLQILNWAGLYWFPLFWFLAYSFWLPLKPSCPSTSCPPLLINFSMNPISRKTAILHFAPFSASFLFDFKINCSMLKSSKWPSHLQSAASPKQTSSDQSKSKAKWPLNIFCSEYLVYRQKTSLPNLSSCLSSSFIRSSIAATNKFLRKPIAIISN